MRNCRRQRQSNSCNFFFFIDFYNLKNSRGSWTHTHRLHAFACHAGAPCASLESSQHMRSLFWFLFSAWSFRKSQIWSRWSCARHNFRARFDLLLRVGICMLVYLTLYIPRMARCMWWCLVHGTFPAIAFHRINFNLLMFVVFFCFCRISQYIELWPDDNMSCFCYALLRFPQLDNQSRSLIPLKCTVLWNYFETKKNHVETGLMSQR